MLVFYFILHVKKKKAEKNYIDLSFFSLYLLPRWLTPASTTLTSPSWTQVRFWTFSRPDNSACENGLFRFQDWMCKTHDAWSTGTRSCCSCSNTVKWLIRERTSPRGSPNTPNRSNHQFWFRGRRQGSNPDRNDHNFRFRRGSNLKSNICLLPFSSQKTLM